MRRTTLAIGALALVLLGCVSRPAPTPVVTPSPTAAASSAAPSLTAAPSSARPSNTPSPAASSSTTIVGGRARTVNATEAWAISVPESWQPLDLTAEDFAAIVDSMSKTNPDLANYMRALQTSGQKVSYLAIDPESLGDGVPRGVNIIVIAASGMNLDLLGTFTVGTLKNLPGLVGEVESEKVDVGGNEAFMMRYVIEVGGAGLQQTTRQYLFVEGGKAYVVTMSADAGDDEADALFDEIADSLEIG